MSEQKRNRESFAPILPNPLYLVRICVARQLENDDDAEEKKAHLKVRPRKHVLLRHRIVQPRRLVRHSSAMNLKVLALQSRDDDLAGEGAQSVLLEVHRVGDEVEDRLLILAAVSASDLVGAAKVGGVAFDRVLLVELG